MSILLGIDQSLAGRLAHGRLASPRERRKTARPKTCLTVVERMSLQRARGKRIAGSRACAGCRMPDVVALRRTFAVAAMG
jgi:hypothetical protein